MGAFDINQDKVDWTKETALKIKKMSYPDDKEIQNWCDKELKKIGIK